MDKLESSKDNQHIPPANREKKLYTTPILEHLGDIRAVVLGGTPGYEESGYPPTNFRLP